MHYADIAAQVAEHGIKEIIGATPAISVNTALNLSIENDPNNPFYKARPGIYGLRARQDSGPPSNIQITAADVLDEDETPDVVQALGMFWLRSNVLWKRSPSILGRQQIGSDPVDFAEQRGIYLLHDRRDVIYIGRSTDRPIGQRLYEHTLDRLSGRWDRFSWFGIRPISEEGRLEQTEAAYGADIVISALESVLIEALEPPLNRRRGDNLNAVEFMQALDPEIELKQKQELLQKALQALAPVNDT